MRLLKSSHFCNHTKKFTFKVYQDYFNFYQRDNQSYKTSNVIPLFDEQNNPLSFEHGMSEFKDFQLLGVQENPEIVPTGLLCRGIEVFLQEDLVDSVKPGERV